MPYWEIKFLQPGEVVMLPVKTSVGYTAVKSVTELDHAKFHEFRSVYPQYVPPYILVRDAIHHFELKSKLDREVTDSGVQYTEYCYMERDKEEVKYPAVMSFVATVAKRSVEAVK